MRIHVAARNKVYAQQFAKNNPNAENVILHRGSSSLFTLLQSIIDGEDDYALFVHDDVFLPISINDYVLTLIDELNTNWPNWGICGNAGITAPALAGGGRACRFLFDPHGGPSLGGLVLPAETVDGNTILLNCRALRNAAVRLPSFEGFQFYDISLSVETLAGGLAVLLAPQLACYHNSKGNQSEFDRAFGSKALIEYLSGKLVNRSVNSLNGILKLPFTGEKQGQFDICTTSLRNAAVGRPEAKVAFVIRSQFRNVPLLLRAITSTLAFAAATDNRSIKTYVVTENSDHAAIANFPTNVGILAADCPAATDTRNHLINAAVNSISEDFVLFLDDDDWVFPNEAAYIADLLTCLPPCASLVVESQRFSEAIMVAGETDWRNSSLRPQRRFVAQDWPKNFTGNNYIPMCGAFYSRIVLSQQPTETYEKITYHEDFTVSLFALLNPNSVFFSVPKLISGISIRDVRSNVANTVNVTDRTKWNQSQAELAHYLCANSTNNVAYSIGDAFASRAGYAGGHVVGQQNAHLSWLDRKSIASTRFIHGLMAGIIRPADYSSNLKRLGSAIKSDGVRGGVRAIAEMRNSSNSENQGVDEIS
ncbi:hypothetical protein HGG72_11765 [Ochrobactrum pecoris]|uniref:Uncharacterized protein n=1 Tax=Brucella pecoris TaxID=867683 RepID=A0A5C5CBZ3_9HYPH|nr:hypothetical protein [Brucella pecoris]MBB4096126.1 hypothetical protein [Brucella pecoris]NKW80873.1 hypothetical protein [Brucella pecoris]TNV08873.1 hypothetical protein FIB18_22930 [Brucella pecoris]